MCDKQHWRCGTKRQRLTCLVEGVSPCCSCVRKTPSVCDAVAGRSLAASMQGMGLAGGEEDAETGDMDGMVGNIMRQLLSKDVLHQSMKVAYLAGPCR